MSVETGSLSVLIRTDAIEISGGVEQALLALGPRPDWHAYERLADIESASATPAWTS